MLLHRRNTVWHWLRIRATIPLTCECLCCVLALHGVAFVTVTHYPNITDFLVAQPHVFYVSAS